MPPVIANPIPGHSCSKHLACDPVRFIVAFHRLARAPAKRLSSVMARLGFQHKANVRVAGLSVTGYISVDDPLFGG